MALIYVDFSVRYWQSEKIYYMLKRKYGISDINIYHGRNMIDDRMIFITNVDTWNQAWSEIVGTCDGRADWECDLVA